MNTFAKKLLATTLASTMLLLGGCGGTTAPAPTASGTPAAPAKEIVLNFPCIWVAKDSKAQVFGEMVAAFNEENKGAIKVVIEEQTDYQAYRDKIRTMVSAGTAPDIFTFDTFDDAVNFANSGKLLDLTPYMDDAWKNSFDAGVIDGAMLDGKLYNVPYEAAAFPVMYNKKLLASVGYNEFPKTYDELFDCCEKLKAQGIAPMSQMTGENAYTTQLWYSQAVVAIGGKDVYANGLEDPAFVQAAEVVQKMYEYTTSDAIGAGAAISAGHFLNERTAIFMNGPWFLARIAKEGTPDLVANAGLAYAPTFTGGKGQEKGMVSAIQARIALGNQTDPAKADAAVKFLKYATNPEWVSKLSASSGALFYIKTEASADMTPIQLELQQLRSEAPYSAPAFFSVVPAAVMTELPQAFDGLVMGEMSPQEFVDTLKALY